MNEKDISVIIVSTKRQNIHRQVLERLCSQTFRAKEIIIVHTGSENIDENMIKQYSDRLAIKYFHEPKKTAAYAKNKGVLVSTGTVLAFLDGNCVPDNGWTGEIIKFFTKNPEIKVIQGNTEYPETGLTVCCDVYSAEKNGRINFINKKPPGHINMLSAENFAVSGEFIRRFRMPFDERLESNEETDFYWKLRNEGISVLFLYAMKVKQLRNESFNEFLFNAYTCGFSVSQIKKIHDDFWDLIYIPLDSLLTMFFWLIKEMTRPWFINHFKNLIIKGKLISAVLFFPILFLKKLSFLFGSLEGKKSNLKYHDHFVTPVDIQFLLTNKCNLRCRHCFLHNGLEQKAHEIDKEHVIKILKSLNLDLNTVSLAGGEPFLNDSLEEICRAFSEKIHVKNIYIFTNGFETGKIAGSLEKILQTSNYNLIIRVSLDGLRDTHNRLRQNSKAFENAVKTIKVLTEPALREKRLKVEVQTTISEDNFKELESLADLIANELKVFQAFDIVRDSTMFFNNDDFIPKTYGPSDHSLLLAPDKLFRLEGYIRQIYNRHFRKDNLFHYQIEFQLLLIRINCIQAIKRKPIIRCTAGKTSVTIFQNYDVSICEMANPIGNLSEFDFDLKHLIEDRVDSRIINYRDKCFCTNSCSISSSIKSARASGGHISVA